METRDVEREDVPDAKCCECGRLLREAAGFASYANGEYRCDACWEKNADYTTKCVYEMQVKLLSPITKVTYTNSTYEV